MKEQIGRYKVLSELGRGAMGVVYKAQDPTIGRLVAIKTIRLGELAHPDEREQLRNRLFREAQSAGILSHPGIVTIYDIAEEKDLAYITMEYVEGQTLEKMLDSALLQDAKYMVSIATQTALALDYAHAKGIIHRDIKPGNIMVNPENAVKITDFGIARIASSKFTHTGTVMGTPSYMSPEQVRGAVVDGRSDMFSLAVVLYEMLTGQKPFLGDSITTVIFKIVSENPVPPKELNPSVGNKVNTVVMRALAKEPAERFQTCKEFAESLQLAVEQTANLTPTQRKIAVFESDPALVTQPARPPASAEAPAVPVEPPPAPEPADAATMIAHAPPAEPMSEPPPPVAAAPPPVEQPAAERAPERKLPPLKHAPAPAVAPAVVREPSGRRWGIWALGALALAAVGAAGFIWQTHQPASRPSVAQPPPAVTEPAPAPPAPKPAAKAPEPAASTPPDRAAAAPNSERTPAPVASVPKQPAVTGAAGSRTINVTTAEPGAQVVVDGNNDAACTTPCSVPVARGRRNLLFTQAGFYPERREVMMGSDPVDLHVTMRAILGTVMLSTAPPGASITVDGKPVEGETPRQLKLPLGRHVIAVTKEGAGSAQQTIEVADDALMPVRLTLRQE